jgi:hypothetical protein
MTVLAFVLGVYLSIRVIAALYGIIDLWYTIGTAYPRVLGAVLGWGVIATTLARALPGTVFLWGFVGYLTFYLSLFVVRYPLFQLMRRGPE